MVHGLAAAVGGFYCDFQVFLDVVLAGEIVEAGGAERSFKLAVFVPCVGGERAWICHLDQVSRVGWGELGRRTCCRTVRRLRGSSNGEVRNGVCPHFFRAAHGVSLEFSIGYQLQSLNKLRRSGGRKIAPGRLPDRGFFAGWLQLSERRLPFQRSEELFEGRQVQPRRRGGEASVGYGGRPRIVEGVRNHVRANWIELDVAKGGDQMWIVECARKESALPEASPAAEAVV